MKTIDRAALAGVVGVVVFIVSLFIPNFQPMGFLLGCGAVWAAWRYTPYGYDHMVKTGKIKPTRLTGTEDQPKEPPRSIPTKSQTGGPYDQRTTQVLEETDRIAALEREIQELKRTIILQGAGGARAASLENANGFLQQAARRQTPVIVAGAPAPVQSRSSVEEGEGRLEKRVRSMWYDSKLDERTIYSRLSGEYPDLTVGRVREIVRE